jgi:hypothetical protein
LSGKLADGEDISEGRKVSSQPHGQENCEDDQEFRKKVMKGDESDGDDEGDKGDDDWKTVLDDDEEMRSLFTNDKELEEVRRDTFNFDIYWREKNLTHNFFNFIFHISDLQKSKRSTC